MNRDIKCSTHDFFREREGIERTFKIFATTRKYLTMAPPLQPTQILFIIVGPLLTPLADSHPMQTLPLLLLLLVSHPPLICILIHRAHSPVNAVLLRPISTLLSNLFLFPSIIFALVTESLEPALEIATNQFLQNLLSRFLATLFLAHFLTFAFEERVVKFRLLQGERMGRERATDRVDLQLLLVLGQSRSLP